MQHHAMRVVPSITTENLTSVERAAVEWRWLEAILGVTVRREKALDFSGCNSRPGTGSLHPVAIETAAEATKLSELSV
jgi:hypothetical protein